MHTLYFVEFVMQLLRITKCNLLTNRRKVQNIIASPTVNDIIACIAALLFERKHRFKGFFVNYWDIRIKQECSYFTKTDDNVNESQWGLCDGHVIAVCYRLTNFSIPFDRNTQTSRQ